MKKLLIISLATLFSCQNKQEETLQEKTYVTDSIQPFILNLDTVETDSVNLKMSILLKNTQSAEKKISEIKAIKQENKSLKKELVQTKAELEQVKAIIADTVAESTKKKKKSFIQKVISTIKKDTVQ